MQAHSSNLSGPSHHLLFSILWPPRSLSAGEEHGGYHQHQDQHGHDHRVGRGGGQDGRAVGSEEEQEQASKDSRVPQFVAYCCYLGCEI